VGSLCDSAQPETAMKGAAARTPAMKGRRTKPANEGGRPGGRIVGLCGLGVVWQQRTRTVERKLAELAGRSHGIVTRAELLRAGITHEEIRTRLANGALISLHRGVYRVGHAAPSLEARFTAAVQACGPGSLLCGRAAGYLLYLLKRPPSLPEVLTARHRRPSKVTVHRCRSIDRRDATTWRGVPVTTVPRTLVDLAAVLDPPDPRAPSTRLSSSTTSSPTRSSGSSGAATTGRAPGICGASSGATSR
jgi:hypothetical protein